MNIIFDMDGVIFDSEIAYIRAFKPVVEADGLPYIEQACYEAIGANHHRTHDVFKRYYGENFDFDYYYEKVRELLLQQSFELKPGVYELFDWLKEKGARVALGSSTRSVNVYRMLDGAGLTQYFDEIVCGDMVSHSKPHPEIFLMAAEKLGVKPEDCCVVEDSFNGIRAAHAAGMHPIMVPDILQPDEEISGLAEVVLPSLFAVKEYLEGRA